MGIGGYFAPALMGIEDVAAEGGAATAFDASPER
jgi:hypothetical protein